MEGGRQPPESPNFAPLAGFSSTLLPGVARETGVWPPSSRTASSALSAVPHPRDAWSDPTQANDEAEGCIEVWGQDRSGRDERRLYVEDPGTA